MLLISARLRLAFASAPRLYRLTLQHNVTRRPVLQKVRGRTLMHCCTRGAPSACKHTVSGSFSLPSRGAFHLSLTVLYSIGHQVVFSLGRWASRLPTEFLVFDGTPDTHRVRRVSVTGLLPCLAPVSTDVHLRSLLLYVSPYPAHISIYGLGSYPFARHYLGNRCFTFSSSGY